MNWLEVSLTVNPELAEAVADVLGRFAPNGVVTEQAVAFLNDEDEGTPTGDITVKAYLPMDERLEDTRRKLEESLYYLGMIAPLPAPAYNFVGDQNWMEAWKLRYQPIAIGRKLMILPAWMELSDQTRVGIKIDPGMAFGTGAHPSTQLCLELLETVFEQKPAPRSVIDVGCGSGILSIAALKLGAEFALGVDIDQAAIVNSRENAQNNGIPETAFQLGTGSVEEICAGAFSITSAPMVLANILAPILIRLLQAGLARLVMPGGFLILAGILEHQAEEVVQKAQEHGLHLTDRRQINDWVALLCQK
ncbi:MAG: 50S ribosomal protein L11 methyltransferase [Anaerolineales bacterium]|nr:50S ribosomal protein L11 methyltransferase [Anaerolineales bacterium]MDW8276659.1 50S ribosomal protein L11 methyltransferase [Anaerolineales bacterium]